MFKARCSDALYSGTHGRGSAVMPKTLQARRSVLQIHGPQLRCYPSPCHRWLKANGVSKF